MHVVYVEHNFKFESTTLPNVCLIPKPTTAVPPTSVSTLTPEKVVLTTEFP